MVVFGAGASYDCIDEAAASNEHLDYRPPLANELFKLREAFKGARDKYPVSNNLLADLATAAETIGIEKHLEDLTNRSNNSPALRRELLAIRFYIRSVLLDCSQNWPARVPGRATHYQRLLGALDQWRDRNGAELFFVTFNYDHILDDAVPVAIGGRALHGVEDYISDSSWKLFKPHGSVNWARVAEGISIEGANDEFEIQLRILDAAREPEGLKLGRWLKRPGVDLRYDGAFVVPALTVPMQHKPFEFPDEHMTVLIECMKRTRWLLLIGWKMTEQHFLDLLREHLKEPRTQIVGRNPTGAEGMLSVIRDQRLPVGEVLVSPAEGFGGYVKSSGWRDLTES